MEELFMHSPSPLHRCAVFYPSLHLLKGLEVIRASVSVLNSCVCRWPEALVPMKDTASPSVKYSAPSSVPKR